MISVSDVFKPIDAFEEYPETDDASG